MANVQVKFYSMSAAAYEGATKDNGALYFVTNGELYKGAQRFGANKVFTVPSETDQTVEGFNLESALTAASVAGAIGGDILTGYGAAKVFNGSTWIDLGADVSSIIAQISDSTSTSTANGITVSVTTSDGYVTGVEVGASQISCDSVTASTGTFTNLVVSSSATFDVTEVVASTLTVSGSFTLNGSTVEQIADAEIAAATLVGSISDSAGTSLTTEGQVVNYVDARLESFGNAMHFAGVAVPGSFPASASDGDIVVIGEIGENTYLGFTSEGAFTSTSDAITTPVTQGQEYVWDGAKWEKIGDESVPSGGTGSSSMNGVEVTVVNAQATAAPTVTLTGVGDAAAKSVATTLDASGANLPTESAVAAYVENALVWLDENNSPIVTA